ncbi:MAG: DUF4998 domain-containing protein [Rikenellaceae bacterium]
MKTFKLTAMLLSLVMALCFTSCEDLIEDVDLPTASAATISSAEAGDGRVKVAWEIPEDENITKCMLIIVAEDNSVAQSKEYTVSSLEQSFSESITNLEAGTYTIMVKNYGATLINYTAVTTVLTVYDATTYETIPTITAVTDGDWSEAYFTVKNLPDDLYNITITYNKKANSYLATEIPEDGIITIAYVTDIFDFTYTASFMPEGGLDEVVSQSIGSGSILLSDPTIPIVASPTVSSAKAGDGRAVIAWSVPEDEYVTKCGLTITASDNTVVKSVEYAVESLGQNFNETFTELAVGTYTVKIQNYGDIEINSTAVVRTITVYDAASYTSIPIITATTNKLGGEIEFTVTDLPDDLYYITISYNGDDYEFFATEISSEGDGVLTIEYVTDIYDFTYTSSFKPTGGLDEVTSANIGQGSATTMIFDIVFDGTTYEIYTEVGFAAFSNLVNGGTTYKDANIYGDGIPTFGTLNNNINAKLMEDIDLSTICSATLGSWTPIGDWETINTYMYYGGTFDGNGKKISGLYISTADKSYQGLFGYTSETAVIKDFTLESPVIISTSTAKDNAIYIGGCIGYATASTISGITVNNPTISSDDAGIGGVVGYGAAYATVSDCHTIGGTIAWSGTYLTSSGGVGGVVGRAQLTDIFYCTNSATVTSGRLVTSTDTGVGGIAGRCAGNLFVGCSNSGRIEGYTCIGGICGRGQAGIFIGCYNDTDAEIVSTGDMHSGGIVGYNHGAAGIATGHARVYGCYNRGTVNGSVNTGGIAGNNSIKYSKIAGCYNIGAISSSDDTTIGAIAGTTAYDGSHTTIYTSYYLNSTCSLGLGGTYATTFAGVMIGVDNISDINTAEAVAALNAALDNVYENTDNKSGTTIFPDGIDTYCKYRCKWEVDASGSEPKIVIYDNPYYAE